MHLKDLWNRKSVCPHNCGRSAKCDGCFKRAVWEIISPTALFQLSLATLEVCLKPLWSSDCTYLPASWLLFSNVAVFPELSNYFGECNVMVTDRIYLQKYDPGCNKLGLFYKSISGDEGFLAQKSWRVKRAQPLTCCLSFSSLQHADQAPTKLQPQMPTAPNVPLTARPRRNKPSSASARRVSTAPRPTHAPWPAHVSDTNTGNVISYKHSHAVGS